MATSVKAVTSRSVVAIVIAGAIACGGSSVPTLGGDGGGQPDSPIGLADAPQRNGDGAICLANDATCSSAGECCSGSCSLLTHRCTVASGCLGAGAPCGAGDSCCTGSCTQGSCPIAGCISNGSTCLQNGDCCSSNCVAGSCAPVTGATCVTEGNSCALDGDCCSHTCSDDHVCINAGGSTGCHATGDFCFTGAECCSSLCDGASATQPGTCAELATFGSGGCMLDGEPCESGTNCCSRVCAPIPGAGSVCQLAAGCRLTGDVCHADTDCCGGVGTTGLGAGAVTCNFISGIDPPLGTCSNPNGNQPEGNICGLGTNAREDCFGCMSPKAQCCKEDSLGVARCYGGSTDQCPTGYTGAPPCCIAAGDACTFSSECCGGVPCIPGPSGGLVCANKACIPDQGVCTATGDCCAGLICEVPVGQPSGKCVNPAPPPTADAGVGAPDSGVCALGGQSCGDATACCAGYVCFNAGGTAHCAAGETDCSCFRIIN